ncbi:lytic transglycosylase catalytic [Candidatus Vecturithrix granuli]|uniref:Lytic transglycosylase catalytic n=1 Tax=Vecturithrix granuli TaxID=1499967 RepID=A0A081C6P9_VECG1|nr:lytic transglycosylase catalytic [Candidatus Vecturithrix granuli]
MIRRNQRNILVFLHALFFEDLFKKFALFAMILSIFLCFPSSIPYIPSPTPDMPPAVIAPEETPSVFDPFPFPEELNVQVDFWKKIFTQYTTKQAVIHDDWYVNVIYDVIDVNRKEFKSEKEGWEFAKQQMTEYEKQLMNLSQHWGDRKRMSIEERRLYDLFKDLPESQRFQHKDANTRIRIQVGQADRFKEGIIQAGQYLSEMKQIFAEYDLPEKLVYLPLIESAFNPFATSFVGAEGMWQFMEGTARQYKLKIKPLFDERRDPLRATRAAAELLAHNYKTMQSWPLAITAYNFGLQGIKDAAKAVESDDIATIIHTYAGPRFGFASRNFYVEFLAAVDVCLRYTEYFGEIEMHPPLKLAQVTIPDYVEAKTLVKYTQLSLAELKNLNPALHPSVFTHGNFLPREYTLNIRAANKTAFENGYASIPSSLKYQYLSVKATHSVEKGQTLSSIAKRYGTSISAIMKANGITNSRKIKVGQKLKIPGGYVTVAQETPKISPTNSGMANTRSHEVKKGQTLITIANMYGTSVKAITQLNGIKDPQSLRAGQTLKIPVVHSETTKSTPEKNKKHRVEKGQTLAMIAKIHNSSIQAITQANAIKNPRRLKVGQILKIPEG